MIVWIDKNGNALVISMDHKNKYFYLQSALKMFPFTNLEVCQAFTYFSYDIQ